MRKTKKMQNELIFTVMEGTGGIRVQTANAEPGDKEFAKALADLLRIWMSRGLGRGRHSTGGTLSD